MYANYFHGVPTITTRVHIEQCMQYLIEFCLHLVCLALQYFCLHRIQYHASKLFPQFNLEFYIEPYMQNTLQSCCFNLVDIALYSLLYFDHIGFKIHTIHRLDHVIIEEHERR